MRGGGFAVLFGTCLDIGDASPLHPVLQALRRHNAAAGASDGAVDAGALLDRVARELRAVAGDRRLLLVLDDLQWADRSTRQLLLYLLAGLGDVQLSVLAAVRAEALHGAHPLRRVLAELRRLRSVRGAGAVTAGPRPASTPGHRDRRASSVEPEDADRVYKRSGGNPFVAEELARDLRDGRVELSDTLREIFLSRVDELPPTAHAVVHALAAGVEPVEHAALARVVPVPERGPLLEAVRAAVAHRFVIRRRSTATACGTVWSPRSSRPRCCRPSDARCTAATPRRWKPRGGRRGTDHARLAHHWQQAGEPARALPSVVAAARAAERLYGFTEAHRLLVAGPRSDRRRRIRAAPSCWPTRPSRPTSAASTPRALARLEELAARPDAPGPARSAPAPGPLPGRGRPVGDRRGRVRTGPGAGRLHPPAEAPRPPPTWPSCCCTWAGTPTPTPAPAEALDAGRRSTGRPPTWSGPAPLWASAPLSARIRTPAWR